MASVDPYLLQLLRTTIEPSPARIQRAVGSHNYLRTQLNTGQFASRIQGSYLSGSYSRDTAIDPLDDVDVVFLVDPNGWRVDLLERIFSAAPKPSPDVILTSFANAVRARYDRSSVYLQRRSIRLELAHLSLDIVPAISDSTPNLIWIPDRSKGEWIRSGPLLHKLDGEDVNRKRNGLFKPLVKVLKFWNTTLPSTARLKSFTIETMAARIFRAYSFRSLEEGFLRFLDFVEWRAGHPCRYRWTQSAAVSITISGLNVPDVAGTGSNVAAGVNRERVDRFVARVRSTNEALIGACNAATARGTESKLHAVFRF